MPSFSNACFSLRISHMILCAPQHYIHHPIFLITLGPDLILFSTPSHTILRNGSQTSLTQMLFSLLLKCCLSSTTPPPKQKALNFTPSNKKPLLTTLFTNFLLQSIICEIFSHHDTQNLSSFSQYINLFWLQVLVTSSLTLALGSNNT